MRDGPGAGSEPVFEKTETLLALDSGVQPARGHMRSTLNSYIEYVHLPFLP